MEDTEFDKLFQTHTQWFEAGLIVIILSCSTTNLNPAERTYKCFNPLKPNGMYIYNLLQHQ
jgi:hypothetical protein